MDSPKFFLMAIALFWSLNTLEMATFDSCVRSIGQL